MVIFLAVLLKIIEINKILQEYFQSDVYDLFLNGYCYEYFLILKKFFPEAKMVIQKDNNHCAALINGEVFDVTGIRNIKDFVLASKQDEDFVYSFYKKLTTKDKQNIKKLIKKINNNT